MHLALTAARNEDVFFAYRVAIPLHSLSIRKTFSTMWRYLYNSLSYPLCSTRFFFGGMQTSMPASRASSIMAFTSYPRSASRAMAPMPSINWIPRLQSAVVPAVINTLMIRPNASTAKCIFELSPLLCVPCPDCHQQHRKHGDEPLHEKHQL